jgi:hypothetical protein
MSDEEQKQEREKELRGMSVDEILKQALLGGPADLSDPETAEEIDEEKSDE